MKNKKIILLGGAGLVGQNLVAHLKRQGYHNLVALDKHRENLAILRQCHPDIIVEYADLAQSGEWEKYFSGADIVVMLQAQIGGLTTEPFVRNNITSTQRILEVIKQNHVPYTVHISSSVVESVADDDYTRTKKEQEKLVLESGIDCVVLRPTLMFGWFDRKHLGWLSRFMQKIPVFPIPNNGRYMRQPLYVGDFCNIIVSCIEKRITGQVFNITGLEKIDYIDMIREIKRATHAKTILVKIPYGLFYILLKTWAVFDKDPPFTCAQLKALTAHDEFEVIDWPGIFSVTPTPFSQAIHETFNDPIYSKIVLEF
ncbi:MAG: NAD-dependent epimerase/dehydratase family protein [Gammaproteobacteria bacterium]|jgi:nucleoside-diphosphate-sugar epimerase